MQHVLLLVAALCPAAHQDTQHSQPLLALPGPWAPPDCLTLLSTVVFSTATKKSFPTFPMWRDHPGLGWGTLHVRVVVPAMHLER